MGGGSGGMVPSKFLSGEKKVLKSPSPNFSNSFFSILVQLCHFFAHLQNSTVGNTVTDAAGLVHMYHIVDLDLYVMLLENSWSNVGPIFVYI